MELATKVGAIAALATLCGAALANPVIIADSVADFGGVQGENGWHYGYYNLEDISTESGVSVALSEFRQLSAFNASTGWWAVNAEAAAGNPANGSVPGSYTVISRSRMHPNAGWVTANVVPDEQWASRRWISSVTGEITISGLIAQHEYFGLNMVGNGTIAHIFVDGQSVFSYDVGLMDFQGTFYSLDLNVVQGSVIEMVVGAKGNPLYDATTFTMRVSTLVPAPGAMALLGLGGLMVGPRRRR